jgi:hypothetical protein
VPALGGDIDDWYAVGPVSEKLVMTIMNQQVSLQTNSRVQGQITSTPGRDRGDQGFSTSLLTNDARKARPLILQPVRQLNQYSSGTSPHYLCYESILFKVEHRHGESSREKLLRGFCSI